MNNKIKEYFHENVEVQAKLFRYGVKDIMGHDRSIIGIQLYEKTEDGFEPYATLTKSFGEFIGVKNCAYIDLNNCPFAVALLEQGVAQDTGFTKNSGFCSYPLWHFNEDYLKEIGGEEYEKYERDYNEAIFGTELDDSEDSGFEQTM